MRAGDARSPVRAGGCAPWARCVPRRSGTGSSGRSSATPTPRARSSAASGEERPHRCGATCSGWRHGRVAVPRVPKLVDVFGSWRQITRFSLASLAAMAVLQVAANACLWDLQRLALRAPHWRPVIASQLASNALSNIAPGGGPVGAALQYRMLVQAGLPGPRR